MDVKEIEAEVRERMNLAYSLRRVPKELLAYSITGLRPRAGDLVLCRVTKLGHHKNLQRPNRSRRRLFVGDFVVVAYANRYASSQFEASVPKDLGPCHLVAGGGCAARVDNKHQRIRGATELEPIGLLGADKSGIALNVAHFALTVEEPCEPIGVPVIAVVGTAMDSGKTTTAAHVVRGGFLAGKNIAYAKVTGTGASGDPGLLMDAGAASVLDFTDVGFASTYKVKPSEIIHAFQELIWASAKPEIDAIVLEVADGVFQQETALLLNSPQFKQMVDVVLLAGSDAMGLAFGVSWLARRDIRIGTLSGAVEAAPLQAREAEEATGLPVLGKSQLEDWDGIARLVRDSDIDSFATSCNRQPRSQSRRRIA